MLKSKTPAVVEGYDQGMGSAARLDATVRYVKFTSSVFTWQAPPVVNPSIKTRREQRWKSNQKW